MNKERLTSDDRHHEINSGYITSDDETGREDFCSQLRDNSVLNLTSDENEVFFGKVTEKEKKIAKRLGNRKTEDFLNLSIENKKNNYEGEEFHIQEKSKPSDRNSENQNLDLFKTNFRIMDAIQNCTNESFDETLEYFENLEIIENLETDESVWTVEENKPLAENKTIDKQQTITYQPLLPFSNNSSLPSSLTDPENPNDSILFNDSNRASTSNIERKYKESKSQKLDTSEEIKRNSLSRDPEMHGKSLNETCDSETKFNDTIEEMELLLKKGINYFNDCPELNMSVSTTNNQEYQEELVDLEKEITVSSTASVNFNPNLDSTHASADMHKDLAAFRKDVNVNKNHNFYEPYSNECTKVSSLNLLCETKLNSSTGISNKLDHISVNEGTPQTKSSHMDSPMKKTLFIPKIHNSLKGNIRLSVSAENLFTLKISSDASSQSSRIPMRKKNTVLDNFELKSKSNLKQTSISASAENLINPKFSGSNISTSKLNPSSLTINSNKKPPLHSKTLICSKPQSTKNISKTPQAVLKSIKTFYTPQKEKIVNNKKCSYSASKNIVSPVAKYLKDNPPPPLIATVKPKYKLRPSKFTKEALSPSCQVHKINHINSKEHGDRNEILQKIEEDVAKLILKLPKEPLKEHNSPITQVKPLNTVSGCTSLPQSVYHIGPGIHVNQKESVSNKRREIPCDTPTLVQKHKGRVAVPKRKFEQLLQNISPNQKTLETKDENLISVDANEQQSLVEISLYEDYSAQRTHTLHRN